MTLTKQDIERIAQLGLSLDKLVFLKQRKGKMALAIDTRTNPAAGDIFRITHYYPEDIFGKVLDDLQNILDIKGEHKE